MFICVTVEQRERQQILLNPILIIIERKCKQTKMIYFANYVYTNKERGLMLSMDGHLVPFSVVLAGEKKRVQFPWFSSRDRDTETYLSATNIFCTDLSFLRCSLSPPPPPSYINHLLAWLAFNSPSPLNQKNSSSSPLVGILV